MRQASMFALRVESSNSTETGSVLGRLLQFDRTHVLQTSVVYFFTDENPVQNVNNDNPQTKKKHKLCIQRLHASQMCSVQTANR